MTLNQILKHSVFIGRAQSREFAWGEHDCLTFLFGWYDYVFGTRHLAGIHKEYHSTTSALRFWRQYPMSVNQWMHLRKFKRVEDDSVQEGDIRILDQDKRWFPSAYIFHNGCWWTIREDAGVRAMTFDSVDAATTTHWRYTDG
jgi:hypothetical protein